MFRFFGQWQGRRQDEQAEQAEQAECLIDELAGGRIEAHSDGRGTGSTFSVGLRPAAGGLSTAC